MKRRGITLHKEHSMKETSIVKWKTEAMSLYDGNISFTSLVNELCLTNYS